MLRRPGMEGNVGGRDNVLDRQAAVVAVRLINQALNDRDADDGWASDDGHADVADQAFEELLHVVRVIEVTIIGHLYVQRNETSSIQIHGRPPKTACGSQARATS